ncbi:hypothetical protein COAQ111491_14135 [Comamonas aquatilis]|uniref:hypothetical protein n=1 Tax=Comamonas aquatilis TaxID=1778406 RepID=UPI0039EFE180
MPKTLQMLLARYMNAADGEGNDLPGAATQDDDYKPGSPEDRGDFLVPDEPAAAPAVATQAPAAAPAPANAETQEEGAGAAEEGSTGRPSGAVPHARFNEVNERRKEVERQLEEARAENERLRAEKAGAAAAAAGKEAAAANPPATAAAFDFDTKESEYLDALMEGETEKAKQIRREVNAALVEQARSNAKAEARAELEQAEAQRSQKAAMAALADEAASVVKTFPYLDSEEGQVAMEMIIERRNSLAAKGMAPHLALREAAALIAPRFAPAGSTPAKDLQTGAAHADSREPAARTRGAQASVAQPPVPAAGMGNRATGNDTTDVSRMDDDQFDRLSEADKRRLRGD